MDHLHTNVSSGIPHFLVFGFFEHGEITKEVLTRIQLGHNYVVQEIPAGGEKKIRKYAGEELRREYPQIFGNWKHGFIVTEEGLEKPVFAYAGPIPDKVIAILEIETPPKFLH